MAGKGSARRPMTPKGQKGWDAYWAQVEMEQGIDKLCQFMNTNVPHVKQDAKPIALLWNIKKT